MGNARICGLTCYNVLVSNAIGGYVKRKDRRHEPYGLHRNPDALLGKLRHVVLPSGAVVTWRDELPQPQTALTPLRFEGLSP